MRARLWAALIATAIYAVVHSRQAIAALILLTLVVAALAGWWWVFANI